jgi:hypothetical protein
VLPGLPMNAESPLPLWPGLRWYTASSAQSAHASVSSACLSLLVCVHTAHTALQVLISSNGNVVCMACAAGCRSARISSMPDVLADHHSVSASRHNKCCQVTCRCGAPAPLTGTRSRCTMPIWQAPPRRPHPAGSTSSYRLPRPAKLTTPYFSSNGSMHGQCAPELAVDL